MNKLSLDKINRMSYRGIPVNATTFWVLAAVCMTLLFVVFVLLLVICVGKCQESAYRSAKSVPYGNEVGTWNPFIQSFFIDFFMFFLYNEKAWTLEILFIHIT